jgi:hypothetical protein
MSIVPLHLQRRFEQRWAARFAPSVTSNAPKNQERRLNRTPPLDRRASEKPKKAEINLAPLASSGCVQSSLPTG